MSQKDDRKKRVPRNVYILRTLMGVYLFYIVSKIYEGLSDPELKGRTFVIVIMIAIALVAVYFIFGGMKALVKREYAEASPLTLPLEGETEALQEQEPVIEEVETQDSEKEE